MTTQDDRYDRRIPGASRPTARNTGLYSDYVPLQRFSMYVQNYLSVVRVLSAHGNNDVNPETGEPFAIDKMEDEQAVLLAAMAHDTDAYEAALDLFNSDEIDNATKFNLAEVVRMVYGEGTFTLPDDNELSVNVNAMRIPKVPMDLSAPDDWQANSITEFGEAMDSRLAEKGFAGNDRDFYSKAGITVSATAALIDQVGELIGQDPMANDPNFTDLFDYTLATSSGPNVNTFWQQMATAADATLPILTDAIIGAALGVMAGAAGVGTLFGRMPGLSRMGSASGDMLEPALGGGIMGTPSNTPTVMSRLGGYGGDAWKARAQVAAPYFGASVGGLVYSGMTAEKPIAATVATAEQGSALSVIYDIGRTRQTEQREQESIDKGTTRGTRQRGTTPVDVGTESYGRVR